MGIQLKPPQGALFVAAVLAWALPFLGHAQSLADALDTTNLVWTTGGDVAWFAQTTNTHDGVDAARSGMLGANQTSWIETTVTGPATLDYFIGTVSVNASVPVTLTINGEFIPLEEFVWPQFPAPYWSESIQDLGSGNNVIRWSVSNYASATNLGFKLLDEFKVLPPRPLAVSIGPAAQTLDSGFFAIIQAGNVTGTPPIQFQWRRDGVDIPNATNEWFYIPALSTNDSGNYTVFASNAQGTVVSSNAVLTVIASPPTFTTEPSSATAYTGQDFELWVGLKGSLPFAYQWRKDGTNLTELISYTWWGSASLALTNVTIADAGSYSLFVTNDSGSIESSNAVLTVLPTVAPVITKHPRSLEVAEGVNTWMSVTASGDPEPAYTWTRIGEAPPPPPSGPRFPPIIAPPSQSKRSFSNVTFTNAGVYFATAKNYGGEVNSREALLTVLPPVTNLSSWWQGARGVFVTNGLAFLAQDWFGLAILSVSNPAAPVMLGGYNTPGAAAKVQADNERAYVLDGDSGLQILSVTNPFNPILVGNYDPPHSLADFVVRSNLAYLAAGKSGLLIVTLTNPGAPQLVGSFKSNFSADCVRVAGDYAYVSSRYSEALPGTNVAGFFVLNIADPTQPFETGRLAFGLGRFALANQTAFGVTGESLQVIALTNPAQPLVIGSLTTYNHPGTTNWPPRPPVTLSASDVQVVNDLAFIGGYSGDEARLYVVDIRDPGEPIPVGFYTNSGPRNALAVAGNVVYFAGISSPLDIIQTPFAAVPPPERLTLSPPPQLQLGIHGRLGHHYDLETSLQPSGFPWTPVQRLFLTNETATLPILPTASSQFFRLHQVD